MRGCQTVEGIADKSAMPDYTIGELGGPFTSLAFGDLTTKDLERFAILPFVPVWFSHFRQGHYA